MFNSLNQILRKDISIKHAGVLWIFIFLVYAIYIAFFSSLHPYGMDEYFLMPESFKGMWTIAREVYFSRNPRSGVMLAIIILYIGKWFFVLLNPAVAITIVLMFFYILYRRLPDFKTLRDVYGVLIIIIMQILCTALPSDTVFWLVGAAVYSWPFVPLLVIICFFMDAAEGRYKLKDNFLTVLAFTFLGIFVGANNENVGPGMLCFFIMFAFWFKYKKLTLPQWAYPCVFGIIIGIVFNFASPGTNARLELATSAIIHDYSLFRGVLNNLFIMINKADSIFSHDMYIMGLVLLAYLFIIRKKYKDIPKDRDLSGALISFFAAAVLTGGLMLSPYIPKRAFYPGWMFAILGCLFTFKYMQAHFAKYNPTKYIFWILLFYFIFLLPGVTLSYIKLAQDHKFRETQITRMEAEGEKIIKISTLRAPTGPTKNFKAHYYDYTFVLRKYNSKKKMKAKMDLISL